MQLVTPGCGQAALPTPPNYRWAWQAPGSWLHLRAAVPQESEHPRQLSHNGRRSLLPAPMDTVGTRSSCVSCLGAFTQGVLSLGGVNKNRVRP